MSEPLIIGNYHVIDFLGSGTFGRVYLARTTKNEEVALKIIDPAYAIRKARAIQKEFDLAQEINKSCPETSRYFENFPVKLPNSEAFPQKWRNKVTRVLVIEYLPGDSMTDFIFNQLEQGFVLDPLTILEFLKQISLIVECLHRNGLVHGDINLGNVFLNIDKYVLIDFGGSCRLIDPERQESLKDSPEVCDIIDINTSLLNRLPELATHAIEDPRYYLKNPVPLDLASRYYLANDVYSIIMCGIELMIPQLLTDPDFQDDFMENPYLLPEKLTSYSMVFSSTDQENLARELNFFLTRSYFEFQKGGSLTVSEFRERVQNLIDRAPELIGD